MSKYYATLLGLTPLCIIAILHHYWITTILLILIINGITIRGVISLKSGIFGKALISKPGDAALYLTFDDGPDPLLTPRVLEILAHYSMQATFFLIADKALKYPELVKEIIAKGHSIASHDLHHQWWSNFRRTKELYRDISESCSILESISGQKITHYRPPVGLSNPHTHYVCNMLGLTITGWSHATRDGGNRRVMATKMIAELDISAGNIILLHDVAPNAEQRDLFCIALDSLALRIQKERLFTKSL